MEGADEGVCGVCGGVLSAPLVACPACDTPHHQDCWSYNGGCAVYACGAISGEALPVPVDTGNLPVEVDHAWIQAVPSAALVAFFGLLYLAAVPARTGMALGSLALAVFAYFQANPLVPADTRPPPPDDSEALALEQKSVLAHLQGDKPDSLAQAYALFEQRRPRESLPRAAQVELGLKLAATGYRVLAAEAIEKALGTAAPEKRGELLEAFHRLFEADPALAEFAVFGPPGLRRELPPGEPIPATEPDPMALLRDAPQYLIPLSTLGFPVEWQRSYRLPSEGEDIAPQRTRWLAGPFEPGERDSRLAALSGLGRLALPVDPGEVGLPGAAEAVLRLSLTSKGCVLVTDSGDHAFPWNELKRVFFARITRIETTQVLSSHVVVGPRGGVQTKWYHEPRKDSKSDSLLEIHGGLPLRRFRVATGQPHLFAYLGRRQELAYATNLRLATKDVVRFAPKARASHGVFHMFGERTGAGLDFESLREFEEYVHWFRAMESPRLRSWWAGERPVPGSAASG